MQKIHVIYSGMVQCVGFRFTIERIASQLGICGFVRNLSDRRVETICEGDKEQLESFLKAVKESMSAYISGQQVEWELTSGEFPSFEIRF